MTLNHRYPRFLAFLTILLLIFPLLAACGGEGAEQGGTTTGTTGGEVATPAQTDPGAEATEAPEGTGATTGEEAAEPTEAATDTEPTEATDGAAGQQGGPRTGGEFHGAMPYQLPPTGHYNTFVTNALSLGFYWDLTEMPMGIYKWADGEYTPLLATEWELVPPDTFRVQLREGVKWSDGGDLTSKDVVTTFTILHLQSAPVWNYLESVEADGDYGVVFKMKDPSNVVERYVLREHIRADSVYGEWATRAQALFDKQTDPESEEFLKLRTEFEEFRPQTMVVSGPYQIDPNSITEAQLTLNKVPTAWNANVVHFDKIVLFNGETPAITPIVLSKQVDYATHGFPPATEKAFEQQGVRVVRPPVYNGPALYINYKKVKALSDPKVRQAVAMAINKEENATVSLGESAKVAKYMAGVPDSILEQWIPEEALAKLKPYEFNREEATKMMQELGYKKQGNVWVSPDGERMEYELGVPAEFADWSAAAQNLAQQLTAFGIKTTVRTVTFTQWTPDVENGRFELGIQAWGQGNPHPYFSFWQDFLRFNPPVTAGPGMSYPLTQKTQQFGEVDLEKLVLQSASGIDKEQQTETISKLASVYNELLPSIPLWERYGNNPVLDGERVAGWPADGDPIYQNNPYTDSFVVAMILDGTLKGAQR